ncbi:maleylpyruvate isomerase family mycothiol-dependent enzyme [Nocardia otitidiscaviarum]|uniref:maleylpyruvate isomerase family mycothiol-dependent enzyme n=1 Tax=Nocardia otitidiscaviarum TaxID=1823 RepID=UPI00245897EE|nr:maleylpyruvate isomerase family mycothiol-dependent enzyme [Nocardia otitidiscaviarum]
MDREASWRIIEEQRLAIADMLSGLSPEQWRTPSLCTGWSVREVAAHVALTPTPPAFPLMLSTGIRARGNYNRFIDIITRRYAADPDFDPVAALRTHAASRDLPKLTNYRNILFDTMVHAQDMAIPLGHTITVSPAAAAAAADRAVEVGWPVWDRHRLDGVRLRATDSSWEHGDGLEIHGPALPLLLVITGRPAGFAHTTGPGVEILATRLGTASRATETATAPKGEGEESGDAGTCEV